MANPNAPFGFQLLQQAGRETRIEYFDKKSGNAIYKGDCVIRDAGGGVDVATAGARLLGVALEYKKAADTSKIAVCTDPDATYIAQHSGSFAAADTFQNCDIVATTGDTSLLRSKHALDTTKMDAVDTRQFVILGLEAAGSNAVGNYAIVKCRINYSAFKAGVSGV